MTYGKKGTVLELTRRALENIHRYDEDRVIQLLHDATMMKNLDSGDRSGIGNALAAYVEALGHTLDHQQLRKKCLNRIASWVRHYNTYPAEAEANQNL